MTREERTAGPGGPGWGDRRAHAGTRGRNAPVPAGEAPGERVTERPTRHREDHYTPGELLHLKQLYGGGGPDGGHYWTVVEELRRWRDAKGNWMVSARVRPATPEEFGPIVAREAAWKRLRWATREAIEWIRSHHDGGPVDRAPAVPVGANYLHGSQGEDVHVLGDRAWVNFGSHEQPMRYTAPVGPELRRLVDALRAALLEVG